MFSSITFVHRSMRRAGLALVLAVASIGACGGSNEKPNASPSPVPTVSGPWRLLWSDDFDGPDNSAPDTSKWVYDIGGNGWGNDELESYTDRRDNVFLRGGMLVIKAMKETYRGPDGVERPYTSGRLKTQGVFSHEHGKFEARIRLPKGQGMWPAFWLLGDDIPTVGWPTCGEIDIFENIGREPTIVHGTMHGPGYSGGGGISGMYVGARPFSEDFHVFGVEWEAQVIRWYVDGALYQTRTPKDLPGTGLGWVFEHPFFVIVNLAVGGNWPGSPDDTTTFPQEMQVDWVRVYER